LDSNRYFSPKNNTTQNVSEKFYIQQPSGPALTRKNFTTQSEFYPRYEERTGPATVKIMNVHHQSYIPMRQDSFVSNVTTHKSLTNSRVYGSAITKDNSRRMSDQNYPVRPLQSVANKPQAQIIYQRQVNEKRASSWVKKTAKRSYCGEMQPDGDSMICDLIKDNDQYFEEEEEEARPKKTKDLDQENFLVKKVSKRQEIINSKKQAGKGDNDEQLQKQKKELVYKNRTSEMPPKSKRRV